MRQISLKSARVDAGLSVTDVSKRLNVGRQTVIDWEKGRKIPKPIYFDALCRLYGFEQEDIFLPSEYTESVTER